MASSLTTRPPNAQQAQAPVAGPSGRRPATASLGCGALHPLSPRRHPQPRARRLLPPTPAGLRLVEPGEADSAVPYTNAAQAAAFAAALADPALCATVLANAQAAGKGGGATAAVWVEGAAFVPSAWSPSTPRGVPPAWNELAGRPDHIVIQVPPPTTYAVRVPGRVCAIYRLE
jgi:hypothetical protein